MLGSHAVDRARLSPLPSDEPMTRVEEAAAIRFSCAHDTSGGWSIEDRHLNPDRTAAGVTCSLSS
jgi:hypothetical protein